MEVYKDIPNFEGRYKVSNYGNVMSVNYLNKGVSKLLVPIKHHTGYLYVHLGSDCMKSVHSLVASVFVKNPHNYRCVNHKDGNKTNNNAKNLEWVTNRENVRHAIYTGLRNPHLNNHPKGKDTPNSRAVNQFSKTGTFIRKWDCISDAARYIGCKPCTITNNAAGRTKSVHGFVWRYADE